MTYDVRPIGVVASSLVDRPHPISFLVHSTRSDVDRALDALDGLEPA